MPNHKPYDALIVGGGHNGLTCACYLAGAGLKVRVLERRPVVGGAAVTEEFFPGFRNSAAAYTVSLLHPKVIRDLRLAEHGLRIVERPMANFLPLPGGLRESIRPRNRNGPPARRNPVLEPAPNRAHASYVNFAHLRTPRRGAIA